MTCNVFGGTLNLAQSAQPAFDRERGASAPGAGRKRPDVGTQTLVPLNFSAVVAPLLVECELR